jgi:hypothetical protein
MSGITYLNSFRHSIATKSSDVKRKTCKRPFFSTIFIYLSLLNHRISTRRSRAATTTNLTTLENGSSPFLEKSEHLNRSSLNNFSRQIVQSLTSIPVKNIYIDIIIYI